MKEKKVFYLLNCITIKLSAHFPNISLCQQYAWWLIEELFQKTKTELIAQNSVIFDDHQEQTLHQWLYDIIQNNKPIQYILGSVPFNDLTVLVEPPTLIPRPETEEWCANLIEQLKKLNNQKIIILDLATGSGCIGLALAYHLPHAHVHAIDIADSALTLARKNSSLNNVHNITFFKSDLLNQIPALQKFDLIVSNPPYIAQSERHTMDNSVLQWEDEQALFAQDDGLALIKKIIIAAPHYLQQNNELKQKNIPQLMIEIGHKQATLVTQLMLDAGYNAVQVLTDLGKKERVVVGRTDNVAITKT